MKLKKFQTKSVKKLLNHSLELINEEANKKIKEFTQIIERKRKLLKDKLTGLPNRNKLLLDLGMDTNKQLALFNINGFNEVNDFFGYEIGDKYLIFIA